MMRHYHADRALGVMSALWSNRDSRVNEAELTLTHSHKVHIKCHQNTPGRHLSLGVTDTILACPACFTDFTVKTEILYDHFICCIIFNKINMISSMFVSSL